MMGIELSEKQRQTVGTAITIVSTFVILLAIGAIFYVLGLFVSRFSNVFLPLAVAGVLALVLRPFYLLLHERWRMPMVLAVALVLLSLFVPVLAFTWFFGALLVEQISDLIDATPGAWRNFVDWFQERWPRIVGFVENNPIAVAIRDGLEGQSSDFMGSIQSVGGTALTVLGRTLSGIATIFTWAVLPVYFVFFLVADPKPFKELDHAFPFLKSDTRRNLIYLLHEFVNILVAFFRGQLIIAFLQGVLYAVGFSAIGLRYGLVLGLVLGFLNIIPYLGSIVGLGVGLPLAFFQQGGGLWLVGAVLIVFTVVQMIEGYLLTPRIMGNTTGLHPMMIIIAVFFWGSALNGIAGMILAIPLTAFLVVFWRLAKERYIGELV